MSHRLFFLPFLAICTFLLLAGCEDSEERAERHYQSALELLEEEDIERALVELRNVIKFDVNHQDGRLLYAKTLEGAGEVQESISQYLRLVEQNPDLLDARIPLTRMSLELNAWEEALRHGRAARELDPENIDVIFLNAVLDYHEAIKLENLAALDVPLDIAKAKLDENPADQLAWRVVIDHALTTRNLELALRNIEAALSHRPDDYDLYVAKLRILSTQEDVEAVGTVLQSMTERFPEDLQTRNMLLSWYMQQGDMEGAEVFLRKLADVPEAGVTENLRVVDFLRRTQSPESARSELERLIAASPEDSTYLAMRAALDFEDGNTNAAISTMKGLLDEAAASEETANLKINLARMLVSDGDVDSAKTLVDEVLAETRGHVEALKMRAAWQIEGDRPEDAILTLRTAQAGAPRDPDIMILMGQAYERAGARELAGERYALAVEASGRAPGQSLRYADFLLQDERLEVAETVITEALAVAPANVDLLTTMADIQLRQQDWDSVTRLIWQLRALEGQKASVVADRIEAAFLLQQSRTGDAIAFLGELADADESDTAVLADLINALVQGGKLDTARTMLDERLQQDLENPDLRFLSAGLYLAEGEEDQAEAAYRVLLDEYPGDPRTLLQLNRMLVFQEREDDLAKLLRSVAAAQPDAVLPRLLRAEQLERLQDFEGAIAVYEELYAANTGSPVFANNLASLITMHRDDEESLSRAYTVARRLRGTDVPAFQDTYGWIAFRRGNYAEALDYLISAAEGLPNNPLVYYHLGEAYMKLGRISDAREALSRAIKLSENQEFPQIDRARELLNTPSGGD